MSSMTPEETAGRVATTIARFGTAYMLDPALYSLGSEQGYQDLDFYFVGRGGVLGEVHADVIHSAFGFFDPAMLAISWNRGREVGPVAVAVELFGQGCVEYGRRHFGAGIDYAEVADLAEIAVAGAEVAGLSLFAGWRNVTLVADPEGRTAQLLNMMREFRGGAHIAGVRSAGLTPLEAVLVNGGPGNARFLGHQGPFPEVGHLKPLAEIAEENTSRIAASLFEPLTGTQRARFVDLIDQHRAGLL